MSVQAISRSFDVLEALAPVNDLGLVELAGCTGLHPSTVHRLLQTLIARGYVTQDPRSRRYLLTYKVSELSDAVTKRHQHLRVAARPHLEMVVKLTGESANLSVLEPPNLVYVDQVEGSRSVRMFARRGAAVPAHATAAGKAMLAWAEPEVVARLAESLVQLTPHTVSTHEALRRELARVRASGYAIDKEEQEVGVGCVAAPIGRENAARRLLSTVQVTARRGASAAAVSR